MLKMAKTRILIFVSKLIIILLIYKIWSYNTYSSDQSEQYTGRHTLAIHRHFSLHKPFNCSPRAVDSFPADLFTEKQRKSGALILHFIGTFYMFIGLAIVCEDYFVPSLEIICEKLRLQPDVAGATFMAAGSSAPELATVMIGVFIAKDDIGLGSVVGSADYNLFLVIGLCALFAPPNTLLNWWPLFRDCAFYSISIVILVIVIYDGFVYWYEGLIMIIFYGLYILLNYFNPSLEVFVKMKVSSYMPCCLILNNVPQSPDETFLMNDKSSKDEFTNNSNRGKLEIMTENGSNKDHRSSINTVDVDSDLSDQQNIFNNSNNNGINIPTTSTGAASKKNQLPINLRYARNRSLVSNCYTCFSTLKCPSCSTDDCDEADDRNGIMNADFNDDNESLERPLPQTSCYCKMTRFCQVFYEIINWPLRLFLVSTTPDCRIPYFRNWYWITFFASCIWISFYSYIMIWLISIIGDTLGIPDTVMGLTFIAAGSSVPDAIGSVLVVKNGEGDMALSNAVGSNVFDILICMGIPWFLKTAITKKPINVYSQGLLYGTVTLFTTVLILLVVTHVFKWRLTKRYGWILIGMYFLFLILCSIYEFNIVGNLHPPACKKDNG